MTSALEAAKRRMEQAANRHRRAEDFTPGEQVWLSTRHLPLRLGTKKLAARFAGPYRVLERISREAYRIAVPEAWKVHDVYHTSQLKHVAGQPRVEAPVLLEDGSEEYEVARILGTRMVKGRREYLISWKGYGAYEDSWEPEGNLANAEEKIAEFW